MRPERHRRKYQRGHRLTTRALTGRLRHGVDLLRQHAGKFFKRSLNVREGRAPYSVIHRRFLNGARLTGTHLCILIVAMLVACIGLDTDSDIAIVGAMLICPLMGSVLAIAYGIATLDRGIAAEAIAGLALQMAFCLATSTIYFKLSPIASTTAALVDNSTPTVWDLAVALAGGFAGGLGMSRDQEPATLISGVAVATALMPPLCAAGFGIAAANLSLFLSALYEFGINVVFIALATETVLLALRVPLSSDLNNDGVNDVCVTDKAGSEPGVKYIVRNSERTLEEGNSGRLVYNLQRYFDEQRYVHPIPKTALDKNPDLGQNAAWK